jgi:hypothetical protein
MIPGRTARVLLGILAVAGLGLTGCTAHQASPVSGPERSSARETPVPVRIGAPKASVIAATTADPGLLEKMTVTRPPRSQVAGAVRNLVSAQVTTKVEALASYGSFTSGASFSIAGQVPPVTSGSRTVLIRVLGPGFNGRHQAAVGPDGIVAVTLTLPAITPGRWYVAIEDLSQVHPGPDNLETGDAVLDLAVFDPR